MIIDVCKKVISRWFEDRKDVLLSYRLEDIKTEFETDQPEHEGKNLRQDIIQPYFDRDLLKYKLQ